MMKREYAYMQKAEDYLLEKGFKTEDFTIKHDGVYFIVTFKKEINVSIDPEITQWIIDNGFTFKHEQ